MNCLLSLCKRNQTNPPTDFQKQEAKVFRETATDSTSSFAVRARIVSFGEILAVPWKSYLVLDCLHVGEPRPSIQWEHEGNLVQENSKYQVRG